MNKKPSPKRPRTPPEDTSLAAQTGTPKGAQLNDIFEELNRDYSLEIDVKGSFALDTGPKREADKCRQIIRFLFWQHKAHLDQCLDYFKSLSTSGRVLSKLCEILSDREKQVRESTPRKPRSFARSRSFITSADTSFVSTNAPSIFSLEDGHSNTASTATSFATLSTQSSGNPPATPPAELDIGSSYFLSSPPPSPSPRPRTRLRLDEAGTAKDGRVRHTSRDRPAQGGLLSRVVKQVATIYQKSTQPWTGPLDAPEQDALESQCQHDEKPVSVAHTAALSKSLSEDYRCRNIPNSGFFCEDLPASYHCMPLKVRYECLRHAVHYGIDLPVVSGTQGRNWTDYGKVWDHLTALARPTTKMCAIPRPQRTPVRSWRLAADACWAPEISLSGHLELQSDKASTAYRLHLNPLIYQVKSNRFFRKWGANRFFKLKVPKSSSLPPYLNSASVEERLQEWLNIANKPLLGCCWEVLFTKNPKKTKKGKKRSLEDDRREVMLFATSGPGLETVSRAEVLEWFLPFKQNPSITACKAFARLELGFSTTLATHEFKPSEIIEVDDKLGDGALEDVLINDQGFNWTGVQYPKESRVMDDGCSTISYAAAERVWASLCQRGEEGPLPSAFQARIGPWKGVWAVVAPPHALEELKNDVWIKTTPSQRKFYRNPEDLHDDKYDRHRLTFEVLEWSRKVSTSRFYLDHLPILEDRGVTRDVFERALHVELDLEREGAHRAWSNSFACARWLQANTSMVTTQSESTEWYGTWKKTYADMAQTLIQSGFKVTGFAYLAELLMSVMTNHFTRIANELRVSIEKSTSVMGIADPTGTLGPNEIFLGFSHPTQGKPYLYDCDALVSRHPSLRSSDVQRVHAVFKMELMHIHDVVVFPVTGSFPLAGKLQGGDYDGDTFWICWDDALVSPFRNAPPPVDIAPPETYGIQVDRTTYSHFLSNACDGVNEFFRRSFRFQWQKTLLGQCTNFHEELRYILRLNHPSVSEIADIHDLLVDSSKNGYTFTSAAWSRQQSLPQYPRKVKIKTPRYKNAEKEKLFGDCSAATSGNIIDHLVFNVARSRAREIITEARQSKSHTIETRDASITDVYNDTLRKYAGNHEVQQVLQALRMALNAIDKRYKATNGKVSKVKVNPLMESDVTNALWDTARSESRKAYKDLQPTPDTDPLVQGWLCRAGNHAYSYWDLLKASALFSITSSKQDRFVFALAGEEICELKARSERSSESVVVGWRAESKLRKRSYAAYTGTDDENGGALLPDDEEGEALEQHLPEQAHPGLIEHLHELPFETTRAISPPLRSDCSSTVAHETFRPAVTAGKVDPAAVERDHGADVDMEDSQWAVLS